MLIQGHQCQQVQATDVTACRKLSALRTPRVPGRLHQGAQCCGVSLAERNDLFSVVNPWRATLPPTVQCEVFACGMLRGEQLLLLILLGFLVWHEGRREHSRSLAYRECAAQICWPTLPSLNECHLFYQQNRVEEEERFREGELEMKKCLSSAGLLSSNLLALHI